MTKKQYKQLEHKIQETLALNQLEDIASEVKSLFEQEKISQEEYDLLLQIEKNN